MAYAFRIHEPNLNRPGAPAPIAASTMSGWTQTAHIAGPLLANIEINNAHGKMGTSIPSIFARMFLFDVAFQSFQGRNIQDLLTPPEYLKMEASLVSECLDLLEFIFQHGSDPKLVVKHWDGTTQIQALKTSNLPEHRRLAAVLEDEITNYPAFANINLFYWKDSTPDNLQPQEFLIGGSSPLTLAFTAPNWKQTMQRQGFAFSRTGDGSQLFDSNHILALSQRAENFKNMIYSMRMAFHNQFMQQATNMEAYIATSYGSEPNNAEVAQMGANPASFYRKFRPIKDVSGADISAAGLPLCYEPITVVSGYEMIPTVDRYSHYTDQNGGARVIPVPLMLDKNGLANVPYIGGGQWNANTCIINEAIIRHQEMHDRELPGGMGVRYPFLIWSDLLEDKIMKVPFVINGDKFITATRGDARYLLPLRRKFFQYFEIRDINDMLTITTENDQVVVNLRIRLNNNIHPYIDIRHTYTAENIVDVPVTLGIFPFYKTGVNDAYKILQCGNKDLNAYLYDVNGNEIAAPSVIRTQDGATYQTRYYDVRTSFDFIRLEHASCSALIIPKMSPINMGTQQFTFSVDFGTSNTYVAYRRGNGNAQTFEFGGNDQQTVYMHRQGTLSGTLDIMNRNHFLREFTPEAIGGQARFHFPTTTATCELAPNAGGTPSLFGTISMGFNMMYELAAVPNARYATQLKWLLERNMSNAHSHELISYYFMQMLWMLKNKAIQNGGSDAFTVCLTFPEAMPIPLKTALVTLWNNAKTTLRLNNCTINGGFSESLAPYNMMVNEFGADSFLNIDIGGGTHDILFINRDSTGKLISANYSSARFAGDDLWGDGTIITNPPTLNNGFVNYLYSKIDSDRAHYATDVVQPLDTLKGGLANTSGDIMSYLFGHDNAFQTSTMIRANQTAYSLVFIHYMALMYHVARLIKKQKVGIPNYISFTGMGSKYMNLISPQSNDIKNLTQLLLEKYTGLSVPESFTIVNNRADAKEITAKGALTTPAAGFLIPPDRLQAIVDYGFDTQNDITYGDMRTPEVQRKVIAEYSHFLDSLQDQTLAQFLHQNYGLTIPEGIIRKLRIDAPNSYNTIVNATPRIADNLKLSETLFFFPLKNALIECSKTI